MTTYAKLRDMVEDGPWLAIDDFRCVMKSHSRAIDSYMAQRGDINAASRLHNELFRMNDLNIDQNPLSGKVSICWWPEGLGGPEHHGRGNYMGNEIARGWLIAILDVLANQEAGK